MIQFFSKPITTNLQDLTWSHSIMCFLCSFWLGVCNISWKYHLISIPPLFGCLLETNKYCKLYLLMLSWVSGFWWVVWWCLSHSESPWRQSWCQFSVPLQCTAFDGIRMLNIFSAFVLTMLFSPFTVQFWLLGWWPLLSYNCVTSQRPSRQEYNWSMYHRPRWSIHRCSS